MQLTDTQIKILSIMLSLFILFPLALTSLNYSGYEITCGLDTIKLISIPNYLVGITISQLTLCLLLATVSYRNPISSCAYHCVFFIILLLFDIVWFFIGGITIMRDNLICITVYHHAAVIFAICIWCISIFQICFVILCIIYIVKQPMCGLPPQYQPI